MANNVLPDPLNVNVVSPDPLNVKLVESIVETKNWLFEIAQGNVSNKSSFGFITKNDNTTTTLVDLWDDASRMVYPTGSESWEVVSDNINDTNGGSGAWNATVISLDENGIRRTETVNLNGVTAVALSGLHTRPHQVILLESGVSGANEGKVTVRVAGGGALRNTVRVGESISFDGHFTVPSDKRGYIVQTYTNFGKNLSGDSVTTIRDSTNPNASWILATGLEVYQSFIPFKVNAFFPLEPGTDLRASAKTASGVGQVTIIYEIILVDL